MRTTGEGLAKSNPCAGPWRLPQIGNGHAACGNIADVKQDGSGADMEFVSGLVGG